MQRSADLPSAPVESIGARSLADLLRTRQANRVRLYRVQPGEAWTTDFAQTGDEAADPMHSKVAVAPDLNVHLPIGVHQNIGGLHDQPTPGEVLCAALASCADSTLRVVANQMGVQIEALAVRVEADVDVRGTLGVAADVPVGFQRMRLNVQMRCAQGTREQLVRKLQQAAEHCCIVLRTLRSGVPVDLNFEPAKQV